MFPLYDVNPTKRFPLVTIGLVIVNALVFLATLALPEDRQMRVFLYAGFVPKRIEQLSSREPIPIPAEVQAAPGDAAPLQWQPVPREVLLSLLTCMFLHGGWLHLIGNLWFLWIFGNNCEDRLGHVPFLGFYLVGGLTASLCHWAFDSQSTMPMIGASGAVAAVLGGYAITWPWARVKTLIFLFVFVTFVDLPALALLGFWFVLQLLSGTADLVQTPVEHVAWWAHVGGFVAGLVLMPLLSVVFAAREEPADVTPFSGGPRAT